MQHVIVMNTNWELVSRSNNNKGVPHTLVLQFVKRMEWSYLNLQTTFVTIDHILVTPIELNYKYFAQNL